MSRFEGKVALVTGGGTGIGRAIAEGFIADGGKVVVVGRRKAPLESLAAEHAGLVNFVQADISKPADIRNVVEAITKDQGRLDALVNNAGVAFMKPLVEMTDEELTLITEVNINGTLRLIRDAVPLLAKSKGSVVNISSTGSTATMPGAAAYSASKSAVNRLTRTLAAELGGVGVRVNAVAPGMTKTDMADGVLDEAMMAQMIAQTPLGRIGQPQDIAKAVLFLASDDASWITGQMVQSSGGFML